MLGAGPGWAAWAGSRARAGTSRPAASSSASCTVILPGSSPFPPFFLFRTPFPLCLGPALLLPPHGLPLSFLALTTASLHAGFRPSGSCGGHPPDAGLCRADPGGSFPWDPLPSAAREGAAGWPGGRRCPPGVSPELALAPPGWRVQGGAVRCWLSHLSTPWEGRQGLGRERSPKWPTLSAEAAHTLCLDWAALFPPPSALPSLSPFLICMVPLTCTWLSEGGV